MLVSIVNAAIATIMNSPNAQLSLLLTDRELDSIFDSNERTSYQKDDIVLVQGNALLIYF